VLKDFKEFLIRGNLVALAVAFVIGAAFAALISSLVADLITPLIAAIAGKPDFASLTFTVNGSTFRYGAFINALITFIIIAAVVFFLIVRPYNALMKRAQRGQDKDAAPPPEYDIETVPATEAESLLNARAADGWKIISVTEGANGAGPALTLVLEKPGG
jgi:large conductance mechanosensitive channel